MLSDKIYWVEHISNSDEPIMELDRKGFMGWLEENYGADWLDKLEEIDYDLDVDALVTIGDYGITCSKDDLTNLDRVGVVLQYLRDTKRELVENTNIYDVDAEIYQDELLELDDMIRNLELIQNDWWE